MPKLFCVALAAVAAACFSPAFAASAADPSQPVRALTAQIRQISDSQTGAAREGAVRQVLHANFDMDYMARAALGTHWNEASPDQQARFVAALETSEARAYADRLRALAGFAVTIDRVTARPDGGWNVDSSATSGGVPLKLVWEVRDAGQGPRIVDLKIAGVSLFTVKQSEFNAYLRKSNGSIEPLVEAMEARAR